LVTLSKAKYKGKRIYSPKLFKKIYKKINKLSNITCDLLTYEQSTKANKLYSKIESMLEQTAVMIDDIANKIIEEGICDDKTSNIIFGADPMIKDWRKVFRSIPAIFTNE